MTCITHAWVSPGEARNSKHLEEICLNHQSSKALSFHCQPSKLPAPHSAAWLVRGWGGEVADGFTSYNSPYINCGIVIWILLGEQLDDSRLISYEDMLRKWTCHVQKRVERVQNFPTTSSHRDTFFWFVVLRLFINCCLGLVMTFLSSSITKIYLLLTSNKHFFLCSSGASEPKSHQVPVPYSTFIHVATIALLTVKTMTFSARCRVANLTSINQDRKRCYFKFHLRAVAPVWSFYVRNQC